MQIQDIFEQIKSAAKWNDCHSKSFKSDVVLILQEFEKQIRNDQDNITRHKCAENIMMFGFAEDYFNDWLKFLESVIINTKSI